MGLFARRLKALRRQRTEPATEPWVRDQIAAGGGGSVAWSDVTGKPSTFTPSSHTHPVTELGSLASSTIVGRVTGGTGAGEALTPAQVRTLLNVADGANNYSHPNHTGDVTSTGDGATVIAANAVTNAKLADMATARIKGRTTAGTGDPEDLTGTQVTAMLDAFTSGAKGLVPASGGGTTNFLRADGTFAAPPGGSAARAGHIPMTPAATLFVANAANATALGTQVQVANRNVIAPFVPAYDMTIDQLGISISTLLAGSNCKVVIYASDSSGRPTTVLRETANISCAATGTVFASITPLAMTAGTTYWIGIRASGTFTLRTLAVGALPVLSWTNAATPVAQQVLILTETFANAAATWVYASSQHSNALMPLVLMRVA